MTRIALAALAAFTSLTLAGPAAAEDPFEVSKQKCIENNWMDTYCLTNDGSVGEVVFIGDIVEMLNSNMTRLRSKNGWGNEVDEETRFPLNASLVMG